MKSALVISTNDNVATALEGLEAGRELMFGSLRVVTCEPIPSGHKVAVAEIAVGQPVIKYGSPIGIATASIAAGSHVHVHNVSSARGRGDLHGTATSNGPEPAHG